MRSTASSSIIAAAEASRGTGLRPFPAKWDTLNPDSVSSFSLTAIVQMLAPDRLVDVAGRRKHMARTLRRRQRGLGTCGLGYDRRGRVNGCSFVT